MIIQVLVHRFVFHTKLVLCEHLDFIFKKFTKIENLGVYLLISNISNIISVDYFSFMFVIVIDNNTVFPVCL